jgi:phytoene/squalene synthetase
MQPDVYCQQKAAQSGSSFYRSFRFLPAARRRAITALYAFCREVDDVVDDTTDVGVARIKLVWWRGQVAAIFGGAPQHPVAQALRPVVAEFALREAQLQASSMAWRWISSSSATRLCDARALLRPGRRGVGLCRRKYSVIPIRRRAPTLEISASHSS